MQGKKGEGEVKRWEGRNVSDNKNVSSQYVETEELNGRRIEAQRRWFTVQSFYATDEGDDDDSSQIKINVHCT